VPYVEKRDWKERRLLDVARWGGDLKTMPNEVFSGVRGKKMHSVSAGKVKKEGKKETALCQF